MPNKETLVLVGAKVPPHWKEQIEGLATARGQSSSEIVREAIAAFLNLEPQDRDPSLDERITAALDRLLPSRLPDIASFNQKIETLSNLLAEQGDRLKKSNPKPKGFG